MIYGICETKSLYNFKVHIKVIKIAFRNRMVIYVKNLVINVILIADTCNSDVVELEQCV